MHRSRRYTERTLLFTSLGAVLMASCLPGVTWAADPIFDNKGFSPFREFSSPLSFEHIDPLTGNLLLTFTDLALPGNAGFDLRIQRSYNIKIYSQYVNNGAPVEITYNDPAGLGWTLHFGKLTSVDSLLSPVVIEMPDGSGHQAFKHMSGSPDQYMTRDLWSLDMHGGTCDTGTCPLLRLPNGVQYLFAHGNNSTGPVWATKITDAFGNEIDIDYLTYQGEAAAYVSAVHQHFGSDVRDVTFTYDPAAQGGGTLKRLRTISFEGRTWTYTQQVMGDKTMLTSVQPPAGAPWTFAYFGPTATPGPYLMQQVTTPFGGTVSYQYQAADFWSGAGFSHTPAILTRTPGGVHVPTGATQYQFTPGSATLPVVTTVTEPCRTTIYETYGLENGFVWRLGALKTKTISGGGASQTEAYGWKQSEEISRDNAEGGGHVHAPLLETRTITRDGSPSYNLTHTYHTGAWSSSSNRNFNDYGNPERTVESGHLSRTIDRTFFHPVGVDLSLNTYIAGRVETETTTVFGEQSRRTFSHLSNGFMREQNIHGLVTKFDPDSYGNVRQRTDAKDSFGNPVKFTWQWGVPRRMDAPNYSVDREISRDSTIRWERWRNAFTTFFGYDGLFRMTSLDPPEGNTTTWTWATTTDTNCTSCQTVAQTRGVSSTKSYFDGFGRLFRTSNTVGVKTDTEYDNCGRAEYQSFPYSGSSEGTHFEYDGLDRLRFRRNTDPSVSTVTYTYSNSTNGRTVTIQDENNHLTDQLWKGFGSPDDAWLFELKDAGSGPANARETTTYSYNGLGSLTRVDGPLGPDRTWTYYATTDGYITDRVSDESHPESGTVHYTYFPNGLIQTRKEAAETTAALYTYDRSNRLTDINRPNPELDTEIRYDGASNRTYLKLGSNESRFDQPLPYDGNNRLRQRVDRIDGRTFTTRFDYDSRDNLQRITYPTGNVAFYTYDSENRISSVTNGGSQTYASSFTYHPSGGVSGYLSGNQVANSVGYDPDRYWITGTATNTPTVNLLSLGYGHDSVGNVTSTTDPRVGNFDYFYDNVDRLKNATPSTPSPGWPQVDFTYDAMGNRLTRTFLGQPPTQYLYTDVPQTNRLRSTQSPNESFGYDANGSMTSRNGDTYVYGADKMLVKATVSGQPVTTYTYDGDNLRTTRTQGATTTFFVHGLGGQLISEWERIGSAAPTAKRDYIYAGSRLIASLRPPVLVVAPTTLAFAGVVGSPAPLPQQQITVSELSGGQLSWTATKSANAAWLTISPTSGTSPGQSTISVTVNIGTLEVGTYAAEVVVSSTGAGGSPKRVEVLLEVTSEAGFVVLPRSLSFQMTDGGSNPPAQSLRTLMSGGGTASWTATSSHSWIQVSPSSGSTPGTISVSINGSQRHAGTHRGWITVTAPGNPGSPRFIPVTLYVHAAAGAACGPSDWFCEPFDELQAGDLGGQGVWQLQEANVQVERDPRGVGNTALFNPPPATFLSTAYADVVWPARVPINGSEISLQVMSDNVLPETKQVGKVEFFTTAGQAWGKTGRTFAAIRFGSTIRLQYGPYIYQTLVGEVENGRWYDLKIVFRNNRIYAYVDGDLIFDTPSPMAPTLGVQAFGMSAWDYPGEGYVDLLEGRPLSAGLVVEPSSLGYQAPASLHFESRAATPGERTPNPSRPSAVKPTLAQRASRQLAFEPNVGQTDPAVRFVARARGQDVFATEQGLVLSTRPNSRAGRQAARLSFAGAIPGRTVVGSEPLPGKSNYYRGNDPARWRTNVPHFAKLRYSDVYPGVDALVYGTEGRVEYDFVLAAGVDPGTVRVTFDGPDVRLDADGNVVLSMPNGMEIRQLKPVVYQELGGKRRVLDGSYVVDGRTVGFRVASYDSTLPLVLDPVLVYSTYLGGGNVDQLLDSATGIAVDEDNNAYVVGGTASPNFPTVNAWQPAISDQFTDAFISKFSPDGSTLIYSTYLGGPHELFGAGDSARAVTVDAQGNAYIGGLTCSDLFPMLGSNIPYGGGCDGFVAKLNGQGQLAFSSYVGGALRDVVSGIAVDSTGAVYAAGTTSSQSMAWCTGTCTTKKANADLPYGAADDAFVARVIGTGTRLPYLTYLNGQLYEEGRGIAADGSGAAYVTGQTNSAALADHVANPFPGSPGSYQTELHDFDAFITKIDPSGTLSYSTYFGGAQAAGDDSAYAIAVIAGCVSNCDAFVAGRTMTNDFPVTPGAWSQTLQGTADAYVVRLNATGSDRVYASYLAGDLARSIAVDGLGAAYVGGYTYLANFPSVASCPNQLVDSPGGNDLDAYVVQVDPSGSQLGFCAEVGGSANEGVNGIAVDAVADVYAAGDTASTDFPTTPAAFQHDGTDDGFVFKLGNDAPIVPQMQFATSAFRTIEGDGVAVITVTRRGSTANPASVYYRTQPGTALPGQDYVHTEARLDFGEHEPARAFSVPIVNDALQEPDETLTLQLSDPIGGILGSPSTATLTIGDDDGPVRHLNIYDRINSPGFHWDISPTSVPSWLAVSALAGNGPSDVTVTVQPAGLLPGTYRATLIVTGNTGDSPQFVDVVLRVTP